MPRPSTARTKELSERFITALGGSDLLSPLEREKVIIAAAMISDFEKKKKTFVAAEAATLQAKAWAKLALDAIKLPGSSGHMLNF